MDDNCVDRPKLITDSYREDRYEVTAKLAYEHWEKRGRPLGSPDVDWYAAEATLREYLVASGIEIGPNGEFVLLNRTIRIKLPANPPRDYCPDLRCRPGTGNSSTCSPRSRSSRCALACLIHES